MGNCIKSELIIEPPPYHYNLELISSNDLNNKIKLLEEEKNIFHHKISELYDEISNLKKDNTIKNDITLLSTQYQKLYNEHIILKDKYITFDKQILEINNKLDKETHNIELLNKKFAILITGDDLLQYVNNLNNDITSTTPNLTSFIGLKSNEFYIRGIKSCVNLPEIKSNIKLNCNINTFSDNFLIVNISSILYGRIAYKRKNLSENYDNVQVSEIYIDNKMAEHSIHITYLSWYPDNDPFFIIPITYNTTIIYTNNYDIISINRNFTFNIDDIYSDNKETQTVLFKKIPNLNNNIKDSLLKYKFSQNFVIFDNAIFEVIKDKL